MHKEKTAVLVRLCLSILIAAGFFACCKLDAFAMSCSNCHGFNVSGPTEIAPTCTEAGKREFVCSDCGTVFSYPSGEPIDPNAHSCLWIVETAATESSDGREVYQCTRCFTVLDSRVIPATASGTAAPVPAPAPEPPPEPAITEEPPVSISDAPEKEKEETVSKESAEEPTEEKSPWEGEEFYIDPETKEKVFKITGAVIGAAVLIGILRAMVLSVKARKARAAAKAAEAALKNAATKEIAEAAESEFEKPEIELEIRTILACLTDSEDNRAFTKFLSRKKYIKLETADAEERESLAESIDDYDAELFIFDVASKEDVDNIRELIKSIKEEDKYKRFSILVKGSEYKSLKPSLEELKAAHEIEGYASDSSSADSKLVNLVLPVYKPRRDGDSVLGYMASVADALGIPYVSEAIEYFSTGKEIVEALKSDDLETMDRVSLIGNIASVLGIDKVVEVTDFIDKVSEAKEIICGNETEEAEEIENS